MSINKKLKLAILCAALSGVTIACTKNDDSQTLALAPQNEGQVEAQVEDKGYEAPAKTPGDLLGERLMVLANQAQPCDSTSEIIAGSRALDLLIIDRGDIDGIGIVRSATSLLAQKVNSEEDPFCQIDAIAQVSQKMFDAHIKMSPYPKTEEQKAAGLSKVEAFLAGIQPTVDKVKPFVKIKADSIAQRKGELADADAQIVEKMAQIGEHEAVLKLIVADLEALAACSAYNCNQKTSDASYAAKKAKETLASIDSRVEKIKVADAKGPGGVAFIAVRGGLFDDFINELEVAVNAAKAAKDAL